MSKSPLVALYPLVGCMVLALSMHVAGGAIVSSYQCTTFCEARLTSTVFVDSSVSLAYNVLDSRNRPRVEGPAEGETTMQRATSTWGSSYRLGKPDDPVTVRANGEIEILLEFRDLYCHWEARLEMRGDTLVVTPYTRAHSCAMSEARFAIHGIIAGGHPSAVLFAPVTDTVYALGSSRAYSGSADADAPVCGDTDDLTTYGKESVLTVQKRRVTVARPVTVATYSVYCKRSDESVGAAEVSLQGSCRDTSGANYTLDFELLSSSRVTGILLEKWSKVLGLEVRDTLILVPRVGCRMPEGQGCISVLSVELPPSAEGIPIRLGSRSGPLLCGPGAD